MEEMQTRALKGIYGLRWERIAMSGSAFSAGRIPFPKTRQPVASNWQDLPRQKDRESPNDILSCSTNKSQAFRPKLAINKSL